MARVVLVVPPNYYGNRMPPLGTCYLAAALEDEGHEVRIFDAAAPFGPAGEEIARFVEEAEPDLVGFSLFTEAALATYQLVELLGTDRSYLLAAGGVHATAVPEEPLRHGFDVTALGEGEETIVELAAIARAAREDPAALDAVAGIVYRREDGTLARTAPRPQCADLDTLPIPHGAMARFPREWYFAEGRGAYPAMLMTSRGCTGTCVFCSNLVTGRRYRFHSVDRVIQEMRGHMRRERHAAFSFHDDAFTADEERLLAICGRIEETFRGRVTWWCESRVDHLSPATAAAMKRSGCQAVVFGAESGSDDSLRQMGKGITTAQTLETFRVAKEAGLTTHANFMLGFPWETAASIEETRAFIETLAPYADHLTPMGVPVPYPGTALYRRHAAEYGFEEWWLDMERVQTLVTYLPPKGYHGLRHDEWQVLLVYLEEALIEADFFHYDDEVKAAIRAIMEYRRRHNAAAIVRMMRAGRATLDEQ